MKFYDRKDELAALAQTREAAAKSAQFTLLIGRRRIGKTALLLESLKKETCLYLFVSRKSEQLLCEEFQKEAEKKLGLKIFGGLRQFKDLFEQLLVFSEDKHFTLVIDEFQDFCRVNMSIFSDIQSLWDRYREKAKMNLIVCGSIYTLMVKIFEDSKEPLFGRATSKLVLRPFTPGVIKKILKDHNPAYTQEDLLALYLLSGGVPRYISLLMDAAAVRHKDMLRFVTNPASPFLAEGKDILVSEFGKDYNIYFSILQLIASGKTSQSAVDSIIGKTTGPYLANLEKEYSLIKRSRPEFSKPESRGVRWRLRDSYLNFWFRYIYANQTLIELRRHDLLYELIAEDYERYSSLVLEDYFRAKLMEEGRFTAIGSWWDKKGENEIDIVAVSGLDRTALVAEVKRNPKKINMNALREKALLLRANLAPYDTAYRGFSMRDM
jgi:AAA+ ATPase superfamily predicted ATPase